MSPLILTNQYLFFLTVNKFVMIVLKPSELFFQVSSTTWFVMQKRRGRSSVAAEPQSRDKNKATHQCFLEFSSLKFQESCRKSSMRQQAVPPSEGSQSVNESTQRTWPWLTDGLSQRCIPSESTIHFIPHASTLTHTQANISKVCQDKWQIILRSVSILS